MADCTVDDCVTVAGLVSLRAFQDLHDVDNMWWAFMQQHSRFGVAFAVVSCVRYLQIRDGAADQIPLATVVKSMLTQPKGASLTATSPAQASPVFEPAHQSQATNLLKGIYYLVTLLQPVLPAKLRDALYFPWTKHSFGNKSRSDDAELELRVWKQLSSTQVGAVGTTELRNACSNPLDSVKHDLSQLAALRQVTSIELVELLQLTSHGNEHLRHVCHNHALTTLLRCMHALQYSPPEDVQACLQAALPLATASSSHVFHACMQQVKQSASIPGYQQVRQATTSIHVLIDQDHHKDETRQLHTMLRACQQLPDARQRSVISACMHAYFGDSGLPKDLKSTIAHASKQIVDRAFQEITEALKTCEMLSEPDSLQLLRDTYAHVYTLLSEDEEQNASIKLDTIVMPDLNLRLFGAQQKEQYLYQSLADNSTFLLIHQACLQAMQDILELERQSTALSPGPVRLVVVGGDRALSCVLQAWTYITGTRPDLIVRPLHVTLLGGLDRSLPLTTDADPEGKARATSRRGRRRPLPQTQHLGFDDPVELSRMGSASSLTLLSGVKSSGSPNGNRMRRSASTSGSQGSRQSSVNDEEFAQLRAEGNVSMQSTLATAPEGSELPDLSTLHSMLQDGQGSTFELTPSSSSPVLKIDHRASLLLAGDNDAIVRTSSSTSLEVAAFVPAIVPVQHVDCAMTGANDVAMLTYMMQQDLYLRRYLYRQTQYLLAAHGLSTLSSLSPTSSTKSDPAVAKLKAKLERTRRPIPSSSPSYQLCQTLSQAVFDSPGARSLLVYQVEMVLMTEADNHADKRFIGRVASLTSRQEARLLDPSESLSASGKKIHVIPLLNSLALQSASRHQTLPALKLHLIQQGGLGQARAYNASEATAYTQVQLVRLRTDLPLESNALAQPELELQLKSGSGKDQVSQALGVHSCHLSAAERGQPFDVVVDGHIQPNVLQLRVTPCVRVLPTEDPELKMIRHLTLDINSFA
eukprot:TRINITY_DN4292_c0_g1_i1.p1 TRINITY_DN4292_c0_g1~~TRINITY_DN4292_c0_g1_i1.p1  ORF type:complete len:981 (+),score=197.14 TRINITY_DN4292_c0_g1_i1:140-3082(+)